MHKLLSLSFLAGLFLLQSFSVQSAQPGGFTNAASVWATTSTMLMQWKESQTGITGFTLYGGVSRSALGKWADIRADSSVYAALHLQNNTRYYWMVVAHLPAGDDSSLVFSDSTHCNMQGTFSVGPNGYFRSLGQALDSMPIKGMTGSVVLELQKDYSSAVESFPLVFPRQTPCRQNDFTITLRPAADASAIALSTTGGGPLLVLDSVSHVIIDGRPGGTGSSGVLSLTGPGNLVYCRNASDNVFTYLQITSTTNPLASPGLIVMEGTLGKGSSNNIFSWCDISGALSPLMPHTLISSVGNSASGISNTGNQVLHSTLHDFSVMGILLRDGNGGWVIRDNSFYSRLQMAADSSTVGIISSVDEYSTLTDSITDNFFGGSAPGCKGDPMTIQSLDSLHLITITGNAVIGNNHFQRLSLVRSSGGTSYYPVITCIRVGRGAGGNGNTIVTNNVLGGTAMEDSLSFVNQRSIDLPVCAIYAPGLSAVLTVNGNQIQNIAMRGYANNVVGMQVLNSSCPTSHVTNNVIGDGAGGPGIVNYTAGDLTGLSVFAFHVLLNDNKLTGWRNQGVITGISAGGTGYGGGSIGISRNEIGGFRTSFVDVNGQRYYKITGLGLNQAFGALVGGNHIHDLDATGVETSGTVIGIATTGGDSAQHIDGNVIRPLHFEASAVPISGGSFIGVLLANDQSLVQNNFIEMGTDTVLRPISQALSLCGIMSSGSNSNVIQHNTVYIWGKGIPSGLYSSSVLTLYGPWTSLGVYNNIFVSKGPLSVTDTTLRHLMISLSAAGVSSFDYNIYFLDGKSGDFSLDEWRVKQGYDLHSIFADPVFMDPDGSDGVVDLHLAPATPAEGKGDSLHSTALDIDGESRAALGPVDIGADAGNFVLVDAWPPVLTPDSIPNHAAGQPQVITLHVKDDTGVDSTAAGGPVMWLRKSSPFAGSWVHVAGRLTSGNLKAGQWTFTADYAALGLTANAGDVFDCYFVARDKSARLNIGYSPLRNANHHLPGVQDTVPYSVYHYKITGNLPDTIYVGAGQPYTSLTNTGGVFQTLDSASINTHAAVIVVTSDLSETGQYNLNGAANPAAYGSLQIITNSPVVKTIRNSSVVTGSGMIPFYKRNNVIINGAVNGSGKYLRFENTNVNSPASKPALYFESDSNVVIRHTLIGSDYYANSTNTAIGIYFNQSISHVTVDSNLIGNGPMGTASNEGIYSFGTLDRAVITNNEFFNCTRAGIEIFRATDSCVISGNHVYYNSPQYTTYLYTYGITLNSFTTTTQDLVSGGHIVAGNYIGGSAPYCGGAPWPYWNGVTANGFNGIVVQSSSLKPSYVYNNVIQNINMLSSSSASFTGINITGKVDAGGRGGNVIGNPAVAGDITNNGTGDGHNTVGILVGNSAGASVTHNRISNLTVTGSGAGSLIGIYCISDLSGTTLMAEDTIRRLTGAGSINTNASAPGGPNYFSVAGIGMQYMFKGIAIRHNEIDSLRSTSTTATVAAGIGEYKVNGPVEITRNRIYALESLSASGGILAGMNLTGNAHTVVNNQVAITNGVNTNALLLAGIRDSTGSTDGQKVGSVYYYNSVYLGGSGPGSGYAAVFNTNWPVARVNNNIFYNEGSGAVGGQLAFRAADYNVLVSRDTSTGTVGYDRTASSYLLPVGALPKDSLFVDVNAGNLDINTGHTQGWAVNGKGIAVEGVTGDFDRESGVRSGSVAGGATDIGSDEFVPVVAPPAMTITGSHLPGGSDTLRYDGRTLVIINWANAGVLPALGSPAWYSGSWPNDTSNGQTIFLPRMLNEYWSIPATGGSGYGFDISFYYDSAMLGRISDVQHMVINKRDPQTTGSWVSLASVVDTAAHRVTARGLHSFSEWTLTDTLADLATGVKVPDLAIAGVQLDSNHVATGRGLGMGVTVANRGNAAAPADSVYIWLSPATTLTPGVAGTLLLGRYGVAGITAGSSEGPDRSVITIPCNIVPGVYYLYVVADGPGVITEAGKDNNIQQLRIVVTQGLTAPAKPVVSALPSLSICGGDSVLLSVDSLSCVDCSYTWGSAGAGAHVVVKTAGAYVVTAVNGCGSAVSDTARVLVTPGVVTGLALSYSGCGTHTVVVKALVTGGGTLPTFVWKVNNAVVAGAVSDTLQLTDPAAGLKLSCVVTSKALCATPLTRTDSLVINCVGTAVSDIDGLEYFRVGPKPTAGPGHIDLKLSIGKKVGYRIVDNRGQVVLTAAPVMLSGQATLAFDLSGFAGGVYFLQATIGDQQLVEKIVITR